MIDERVDRAGFSSRTRSGFLAIIIVAGVVGRFYGITAESLWHDEAFSAYLTRYPLGEMLQRVVMDVHPPLYYILLHYWTALFGQTEFTLRSLSALFGCVCVYAAFKLSEEAFCSTRTALCTALLVAVNVFQIEYASEARMYTMGSVLVLTSAFCLLRALRFQHAGASRESVKTAWAYWIAFAISAAASLYTHYYLAFSLLGMGLYALAVYFRRRREATLRDYRFPLVASLVTVALYLPWMRVLVSQLGVVQRGFWIPPMDVWTVPCALWRIFVGTSTYPLMQSASGKAALAAVALLTALLLTVFLRWTERFEKWLFVSCAVLPFLVASAVSQHRPIVQERYFIFAGLFFTMMLASVLSKVELPVVRRLATTGAVLFSLGALVATWKVLDVPHPGVRGIAEYVNAHAGVDDRVVVAIPTGYFPFRFYSSPGRTNYFFMPGARTTADVPRFFGSFLLSDAEITPSVAEDVHPGQRVWLVWSDRFLSRERPVVPAGWKMASEERVYRDVKPDVDVVFYLDEYRSL